MEEETKKLIKELLDEGYDSGFISSELGISKKKDSADQKSSILTRTKWSKYA